MRCGCRRRRVAEVGDKVVVIDGGDDLHAAFDAAIGQDHRVRTLFVTDLADRLADVGCEIAFDLHRCSVINHQ
jgi:hypothetical protein